MPQTTEDAELKLLRYPIGGPNYAGPFTWEQRTAAVADIAQLPQQLSAAISSFSAEQLDMPYRPGGWTVRQLIHHVADSHMNAYVRVRLGLTMEGPTILPYPEDRWAQLQDARTAPVALSLTLLQSLHQRWVLLLESLDEQAWKRGYVHPENGRQSIEQNAVLYAWHGRHHTAHITQLAARMGW